MALGVDVRSRDSINGMYNRIRNKFGVLDILVNCAGTIRPAPSSVADEVAWDQLIDIHLTGTFRCCQSAMPLLESSTAASIVNVGSVLGMRGVSARASYAAAKAGVEGLTRVLAVEWAKAGIRVNCVVPGYTMTPMNAEAVKVGKLDVGQLAKSIPLGRLASADDVAAGIEFLASVDSRYITGQTLVIDGGLTISGDWWSATELAIERLSE
jgi:NAD(P)-dependent dehydrogenase (short-subunit alcohol dehydrogenase family)